MGILDNLEEYIDFDQKDNAWNKDNRDKCHYCKAMATYNDLAEIDKTYQIVGVCACHSYQGLVS